MGFMSALLPTPQVPRVDADDWPVQPHHSRVEASARAWVTHGSQRPAGARLVQLARLAVYAGGGVVVVSLTDGVGPLGQVSSWWDEPIVFQKIVVWTLLWQLLGLGRGLAPHGVGALPPVAGLSYWLTPGTMRLPALPERVPFTAGTRRTAIDVGLYAAVLAIAAGLLGFTGAAGGRLPGVGIVLLLAALALLALRDRTPLLATRPEVCVLLLAVFLLPAGDLVFAAKLVVVALWWITAVVRANRHFAFAVATSIADAPWVRSADVRRRLWQPDGHDIVPAEIARWIAHALVVLGFTVPVLLLVAGGGPLSTVAVVVAVVLQVALASALPRDGQLELTAFGVFTTVLLFGHYASVGGGSVSSLSHVGLLALVLGSLVVAAAVAPEATAVLSPTRHAAGSGPVSVWLFDAATAARFDVAVHPGAGAAELLHYRDLALHALHPNGRALDGLLCRAVGELSTYRVRPAEFVAGAAVGWSIGSGFDHDRRLLAAIQERCGFAPGELRVVTLDAHAARRTELRYRVLDAATGLVELGLVDPDDMVDRIPWHTPAAPAIPVEVLFSVDGCTGYVSPAEFDYLHDREQPVAAPRPRPRAARPVPRPVSSRATESAAPSRPRPVPARPRPAPQPTFVVAPGPTLMSEAPAPRPQPHFVVVGPVQTGGRHAAPGEAAREPQPTPRRPRHART